APLPQLGPLPPPDGNEGRGEVSRHLRAAAQAAAQAAARQAEEVLPRLPDKLRVFIGAGLAAMMAVATAFFALARLGALPRSGGGETSRAGSRRRIGAARAPAATRDGRAAACWRSQ